MPYIRQKPCGGIRDKKALSEWRLPAFRRPIRYGKSNRRKEPIIYGMRM